MTPENAAVNIGSSIQFQCTAEGGGDLVVVWNVDGDQELPEGVRQSGTSLVIDSAVVSHAGTYVCTVENLVGMATDSAVFLVNRKFCNGHEKKALHDSLSLSLSLSLFLPPSPSLPPSLPPSRPTLSDNKQLPAEFHVSLRRYDGRRNGSPVHLHLQRLPRTDNHLAI